MKKLINSIASRATSIVSSKATQTAATVVVDKIGPHTAIKKFGTVLALIGIVMTLCGWFILTSWPSSIAIGIGISFICLGVALRYINSILVSFCVRLFQSLLKWCSNQLKEAQKRFQSKKGDVTDENLNKES